MKDTATLSYDLPHHHHQQQQQQHQHHPSHHQHQHHQPSHHQLWNQQQRHHHQHQTHTTSIYGNQSLQSTPAAVASANALGSQTLRSAIGANQPGQHIHHQQLSQYHQQIQPPHNSPYYQQAATHLYPTYQTHAAQQQDQQSHQQQQATLLHSSTEQQDHLSHHHHQPGSSSVTVAPSAAVPSNVVTQHQQQQHNTIHLTQTPSSTQASTLNHSGWGQSIGAIAPQAHHNVVADHQTLAYMTHGYANHTTSVTDHQRNSNGTIANQPLGTSPQGNSYSVEALYGNNAVAAAAAAAAAYNYSTNYNAAFFQASNNGPHTSAGHPTQANLSTFWNPNQANQQQNNHSQPAVNQVQQRQPTITSEPTANYLHDPRLYYGRPAYGQGLQNFGHHSQPTPNQSSDILHHRIATIPQQNQFMQLEQMRQVNQHSHHHQQANSDSTQREQAQQHLQNPSLDHAHDHNQNNPTIVSQVQGNGVDDQLLSTNRHFSPQVKKSQPQVSRQADSDFCREPISHRDKMTVNDQVHSINAPSSNNSNSAKIKLESSLNQIEDDVVKVEESVKTPSNDSTDQTSSSLSPISNSNNTQKSFKENIQVSRVTKVQSCSTLVAQPHQRSTYRNQFDEKSKPMNPVKKPASERERHASIGTDSKSSISSSRMQDSDQTSSIEEGMMGLSIKAPSRKTTWASIASQPAKIAQPKSLKSKMACSNLVLSSAKHLVAVSLDSPGLDSKNGINPAIKSSVSAAATSIQRTSLSPPIPKIPVPSALKLDILGEDSTKSKISWPAVNASIKPSTDENTAKLENAIGNRTSNSDAPSNDKLKDDEHLARNYRDLPFKDQNHNQGSSEKMVSSYQPLNEVGRDFWNRREQSRDYRVRRDSARNESYDFERVDSEAHNDRDNRDMNNSRRDFKPFNSRGHNHMRNDEPPRGRGPYHESSKRAMPHDRNPEQFQNFRPSNNRQEFREIRDQHHSHSPHSNKSTTNQTTNHHYNNIRDGVTANESSSLDIDLHPHLNPENFNPKHFDLEPINARYFIIKSYSEDDIHRSIKYSIWCSTNHGNKRLDEAFRQQQAKDGPIYLFFSVNGSGHFCGMAQMTSSVDFESSSGVWAQSKWLGEFSVKWLYVKDVPNNVLRHITLENNEDKPVTNSRDTQEVPSEKGKAVLKILHQYTHTSSIFDDFLHYERRQEEEKFKKSHPVQSNNQSEERSDRNIGPGTGNTRFNRAYAGRNHDFHGGRDRTSRFAS